MIPEGIHNYVGLLGVALILAAYFLLQIGRLRQERPAYSILNGVGAVLILLSLTVDFNLASFVIEIAWISISIYGIVRSLRARS